MIFLLLDVGRRANCMLQILCSVVVVIALSCYGFCL